MKKVEVLGGLWEGNHMLSVVYHSTILYCRWASRVAEAWGKGTRGILCPHDDWAGGKWRLAKGQSGVSPVSPFFSPFPPMKFRRNNALQKKFRGTMRKDSALKWLLYIFSWMTFFPDLVFTLKEVCSERCIPVVFWLVECFEDLLKSWSVTICCFLVPVVSVQSIGTWHCDL
jgi:hypothetical protein